MTPILEQNCLNEFYNSKYGSCSNSDFKTKQELSIEALEFLPSYSFEATIMNLFRYNSFFFSFKFLKLF
jgi:hypothetical protein